MYVSLCFDVEDYTTPEEYHIDEIPKWLAEVMTEEGVTGTFLVIGEKARSLRDRGRRDVIEAMAKHEIGLHTNFGSHHPTVCEAVQGMGFTEAVELLAGREEPGMRDLAEVFGKEVSLCSRHGGTHAAPYCRVAARWGKPWLYAATECMDQGISWFVGGLSFANWIAISERFYPDPKAVEARLAEWERLLGERVARNAHWTGIFMGHPLMYKCLQFNDALNFPDGKNLPELSGKVRVPEMVSEEEVERAKEGFRQVVCWIRDHKDLEIVPVGEVAQRFGRKRTSATRSELLGAAREAADAMRLHGTISIAQAMLGWAKMLVADGEVGEVELGEPLGPVSEPLRYCTGDRLGPEQVEALAQGLVRHVEATGHIPHELMVGDVQLGAGGIYHVLAEAALLYHGASAGAGQKSGIKLEHLYARYPGEAYKLNAQVASDLLGWPIHDVNMKTDNLTRDFRLQSYTLRQVFPEEN